jgi:anoctamin-8
MNDEEIKDSLKSYVNTKDKFQCTPILISCLLNLKLSENKSSRLECIKGLYDFGAEVNHQNPRTKWRAINWCCYYTDYDSVSFLLEKGAIVFLPDHMGNYPIDLAARQQSKVIVELLFKNLLNLLLDYEAFKTNQLN